MDSEDDFPSPLTLILDDSDSDSDEEMFEVGLVGFISMIAAKQRRQEQRAAHRAYLTRSDLTQNPRHGTPWQVLYERQNDRAYITTMGVDVMTFHYILQSGFAHAWINTPIPRDDVSGHTAARIRRRSLDACGALGLCLHYLNSTMAEFTLQQVFSIIPSTVTRYLNFGLNLLLNTLRQMPGGQVNWPTTYTEYNHLSSLIRARHPLLKGAFGFIDGLNLPVQVSHDDDIENSTYNGWLHSHHVSSVLVFSPEGDIIGCSLNAPGSWHDSRIATVIYEKLKDATPNGFYLVADSAFPRGSRAIRGRIQSALKENAKLPSNPVDRDRKLRFNRELVSCRQAAEWGMRCIQGSFGRLRLPLQINDGDARRDLLETCVRLHNVRTRMVGINQIKNTFMPIWKETDDMFETFGEELLTDIRSHDRVSRFHRIA